MLIRQPIYQKKTSMAKEISAVDIGFTSRQSNSVPYAGQNECARFSWFWLPIMGPGATMGCDYDYQNC